MENSLKIVDRMVILETVFILEVWGLFLWIYDKNKLNDFL